LGDESEASPSKVGGVIPFFFYDAIGRIIPGAFAIVGILVTLKGSNLLATWPSVIQSTFPKDSTAGYATSVILLFLGAAHFLGSILGSLSSACIERPWRLVFPLNLDGLARFIGVTDARALSSRFQKLFAAELNDRNLNQASFLCLYHVWAADQNLGAMATRIDAECLGVQSSFFVSLLLAMFAWLKILTHGFVVDICDWIWVVSVSVIAVGAGLSFGYMRKRRLYGRFALFFATSREERGTGE